MKPGSIKLSIAEIFSRFALPIGLILVVAIGFVDFVTGSEVSFSIFYLLPVSLVTWWRGRIFGMATALISAAVWMQADIRGGSIYSHAAIPWWNALVRFGFFAMCVGLLSHVKRLNETLEERVQEKAGALASEVSERRRIEEQIVETIAQQQRRTAHEIHDDLCQQLAGIAFKAKILEEVLNEKAIPQAADAGKIVHLLNGAVSHAHELAKGLDPLDLESTGIVSALQKLCADTEDHFLVSCTFKANFESLPVSSHAARHLYRIAQQAVANAVKHGQAQRIEIELATADHQLCLLVRDHGVGFAVAARKNSGMGIRIMEYRTRSVGGVLQIDSEPGRGTSVLCLVPNMSGLSASAGAVASDADDNRATKS